MKQRPEGGSQTLLGEEDTPRVKVQRWEGVWVIQGTQRRPVWLSLVSEGARDRRRGWTGELRAS